MFASGVLLRVDKCAFLGNSIAYNATTTAGSSGVSGGALATYSNRIVVSNSRFLRNRVVVAGYDASGGAWWVGAIL
jgi:hypothetical protein